jgi:hypothetical protein
LGPSPPQQRPANGRRHVCGAFVERGSMNRSVAGTKF